MIVDSSALIAILRDEPEADRLRSALRRGVPKSISTGTLLEVSIVVDANRDPVLSGRLDDLPASPTSCRRTRRVSRLSYIGQARDGQSH